MPYIFPANMNDTQLPTLIGRDVYMQIRMIEGKWHRECPVIRYHPLLVKETVAAPPNLSGEPGTTQFDDLWGEAVPATDQWAQPHGTAEPADVQDATDYNRYGDTVEVHARVQRRPKDRTLKAWGFDEVRDLLVVVPASLFDRVGVTVRAGDKFEWDNDIYFVKQHTSSGWWYNTTARLYVAIDAEHDRYGS